MKENNKNKKQTEVSQGGKEGRNATKWRKCFLCLFLLSVAARNKQFTVDVFCRAS